MPPEFVASLTPDDFDTEDMRMLASTIGAGLTARLVWSLGGVSMFCNGKRGEGVVWRGMVELLGPETSDLVRAMFSGERLCIPEFPLWGAYWRWIKAHHRGDVKETALRFGVNEWQVYKIIKTS